MKRISDTAFEKIPQKPDPDRLNGWRSSEVTKWLLADLIHTYADLHEQLSDINFGSDALNLRELYLIQGRIDAVAAVITQLEVSNDE